MEKEKLNEKLHTAIKEIKNISMTALEKKNMRENILNSPAALQASVRSPWTMYSFLHILQKRRVMYYAVLPCIAIVLGGGIVFASTGSLPGAILYPVKVNVVEPLHAALTFSPVAKAQFESSLATERLIEAETLASKGQLDAPKEKQLNALLENHTNALNESLDKLRRDPSTEGEDDDIVTNFQADMNAHARVLDIISTQGDDQGGNADDHVSKNARTNAEKVRNSFTSKGKDNKDTYQKRKDHVQSIIDSTDDDLGHDDSNTSSRKKTILEDTHKTLDQAKQLLKESEDRDKNGDSENAYSKLLDSESSAKEAGIFLRQGFKFKGSDDHKDESQ